MTRLHAGRDWRPPADRVHHRPNAPQQLTLGILEVLGNHGAVQVEVNRIERGMLHQALADQAGNPFESIFGHIAGGFRRAPEYRQQYVPLGLHVIHETGYGQIHSGNDIGHGRVQCQTGPTVVFFEFLESGETRRKGVGLVLKPGHAYALGRWPQGTRSDRVF